MSDIKDVKDMADKGNDHGRRGKRLPMNTGLSLLRDYNEPVECVALLNAFNEMIDTLYSLSDGNYYLNYIWNGSSILSDELKAQGYDEDYFLKIANRMEKLRTILLGDALNYRELYEQMYHELLGHEAYWNKWHEEMLERKDRELEKLRKEKDV